jgi:HSP20 family protein
LATAGSRPPEPCFDTADPGCSFSEAGTLMALKKTIKDAKGPVQNLSSTSSDLLLDGGFLDPLSIGSWTPAVDKCQTDSHVVIRIELPGVKASDVSISFRGENLRIQGVKREPLHSKKLLCYYCLERRYGRFDRTLHISWTVDPRRASACFEKGILTIELPKLKDRRGDAVDIKIVEK